MPFRDEAIVVAVSGGADSMSLLLAIDDLRKRKKIDLRIVAAHFDHKIRPESHIDLEFVAEFAKSNGFELHHGEWKRDARGNLEQNVRNARYDFLKATATTVKAGYVLTAHTMNDQAETFMMNLIRGAGPDGLSRMKPKREMATEIESDEPYLPFAEPGITVVRPLLRWAKRRDTENFCLEHKLDFRRDPMNEDLNFRRVWVRKVLIPMMEEANPKIVESLCRTSELMREPQAEPPASAGGEVASHNRAEGKGGALDLAHLKALEKADLFPVLRDWIKLHRGSLRGITTRHTESIYNLIHSKKSGRVAELPGGDAVKYGGRLSWNPRKPKIG